jgi:hypothetical protein
MRPKIKVPGRYGGTGRSNRLVRLGGLPPATAKPPGDCHAGLI